MTAASVIGCSFGWCRRCEFLGVFGTESAFERRSVPVWTRLRPECLATFSSSLRPTSLRESHRLFCHAENYRPAVGLCCKIWCRYQPESFFGDIADCLARSDTKSLEVIDRYSRSLEMDTKMGIRCISTVSLTAMKVAGGRNATNSDQIQDFI